MIYVIACDTCGVYEETSITPLTQDGVMFLSLHASCGRGARVVPASARVLYEKLVRPVPPAAARWRHDDDAILVVKRLRADLGISLVKAHHAVQTVGSDYDRAVELLRGQPGKEG